MLSKVLALLAVPIGIVAYSSLAKASPKTGPSKTVTGSSGTTWIVQRVSQFQQKDGLLQINDVLWSTPTNGTVRVLRYSQLGSAKASRKYVTSPFDAGQLGNLSATIAASQLRKAAADFGVVLPALLEKMRKAGG
jgi:hypothetical protein